jgi:hypothetical protein
MINKINNNRPESLQVGTTMGPTDVYVKVEKNAIILSWEDFT